MNRQRNTISKEDKIRIIECHRRNEDYYQLADALGIKRNSAYSIIRRYLRDGVVSRQRGGGNHTIVDDEMRDTVVAIIQENCEFTVQQINDDLRRRLPQKPQVCNNTISNILDCRIITLKLSRDAPQQRNTPDIKRARREMADWMLMNGRRELIFIDESRFRLWMK